MIRYLKHKDVDKTRWDALVDVSENKRVYAYSWWLDLVSPGWGLLLFGDYEYGMPLPSVKWFGQRCLIQPILTQQLGVFYKESSKLNDINLFIESIPGYYSFTEIKLNVQNNYTGKRYKTTSQVNQELSLNKPYDLVRKGYSRRAIRNIKKAENEGITLSYNLTIAEFIQFKNNEASPAIPAKQMLVIKKVMTHSLQKGIGFLIGAYNKSGKLIAIAFYMHFGNRLISFLIASNEEGKENSSMFLIVDENIKRFAGKDIIFDFTGSNLEGVSYFNSGFGAEKTFYQKLNKNRFPFLLGLLKK